MNCPILNILENRLGKLKLYPIYMDKYMESKVRCKTLITFTNENNSLITLESSLNLLIEIELFEIELL
jgi:hypothetical protein